ncbi:MAG TPA: glutathione S-transferase family protein [Polyangiaceae bacterium]|jgi:glutathione S-transferase
MRTLYYFQYSPFSRRTRLALAHKGLECELKEARQEPAHRMKAARYWPLGTIPVFVDAGGSALGDSTAITRYLDAAYPERPVWPTEREAARVTMEVTSLVDAALNLIVDVGTRYFALSSHAEWANVRGELIGRAQRALDALATQVEGKDGRALTDHGWGAADMWLFTLVAWLEGLPARAPTAANIAQIMTLPWSVPPALTRWAAPLKERADVVALG